MHWADGGAGVEELANKVVEICGSGKAAFKPLYADEVSLWDKIGTVAKEIYRADEITADGKVKAQLEQMQKNYGHFPSLHGEDAVFLLN